MLLPYTVDFTQPSDNNPPGNKQSFQIQPGQTVSKHGLNLPGKGRIDYGELYNENLLHILENFSSSQAPTDPTKGQLWYDSLNKALKVYDPTENPVWQTLVATGVVDRFQIPTVTTLPNLNLQRGDIVFLTTGSGPSNNKLYIYDGTDWRALATEIWTQDVLLVDGGTAAFA